MMPSTTRRSLWCLVLVSSLASGCASTKVEGTWQRPEFTDKPIAGPVFVVGVARDETVRRVYEDEMAALLGARGIDVVRSYEKVPGKLDAEAHARLVQAAGAAGARYLLSTALIGQELEPVVTQEPVGMVGGYHRWYGSYYGMSYTRTEVRVQHVYNAETSLTDVAGDRVEWTARTRTTDPSDIEAETRGLVGVLVDAMAEGGLIAPAQ
jgi:hypothetical protein